MVTIEQVKNENRALLIAGARAVRQSMLAVAETVDTYDETGTATAATHRPFIMDEQA